MRLARLGWSGLGLPVLPWVLVSLFYNQLFSVDGSTFSVLAFSRTTRPALVSPVTLRRTDCIACLRGGDQEDSEEEEEEGEEDEEEENDNGNSSLEASGAVVSVLRLSKRVLGLFGKLAASTIKTTSRALLAAFQSDEKDAADEDVSTNAVTKVFRVLRRMWKAAWSPGSSSKKERKGEVSPTDTDDDDELEEAETKASRNAAVARKKPDFGVFMAQSYNVEATREDLEDVLPILGGSITDALREARSQARLLVVMIPSSRPGKGGKHAADEEAIKGFLSAEVATVAEKKARAKEETASYVLWSAKTGSAEAVSALKRLKATQTNSKGKKRPILLVAYPAQVLDGGVPKIVPRLLAQHHCSPPPSPEMMAAWLNALRKRHAKQYATMQLEVREVQLHHERKAGYKNSIQSDRVRQERELKEEQQRKSIEKAEEQRREAIEQRREELRASLPAEPDNDADVKTIALRFADGRSATRRFSSDTKIATLFDWVDAFFEMERESLILTTMNGKNSFVWEESDSTLSEIAAFGKMTGLRVTEKKKSAADDAQQ